MEALPTVGRRPGLIKIALGGIKEGEKKKSSTRKTKGSPTRGSQSFGSSAGGFPWGCETGHSGASAVSPRLGPTGEDDLG